MLETHVSWIALAGPYAYKLKKPVRFDFLDYSTPERRLAACETELALNRRWAPSLYLDLQSLAGEPAVRMARFDRAQELDRLVARDAVAPAELAELGADVAGWQADAPVVAADAPYGRPEAVLAAALANFDALRVPGSPLARARLDGLESWTRVTHATLAPWLAARRGAGRVRECHGDLHARNVVRLDGRLTPFDAIDFAPALRWIDVAADVAFLAMDLEQAGRADLAYAWLDGWFAASGDHEAARGLPWFVAYRALVRAKVDALRAGQAGAGAEAAAAWAECERLVAVAEARARGRTGLVVATVGASGSGKSVLAARLVTALPAIRLRADVERKRLAGLSPLAASGSAPDAGLYAPESTARTYRHLADTAFALAAAGFDAVIDATFLERARRDALVAAAAQVGTPVVWLACEAPADVLRARVALRRGDASEATLEVLERQLAGRPGLDADEASRAVRVDTSGPVDAARVAGAIRSAAARPGGSTPASAPAS